MDLIKGAFLLVFMIGVILLVVYFIIRDKFNKQCNEKIVYKYIPRTLSETERQPVFVSQIFKAMFTQPSVWIDSIYNDSERPLQSFNEYNVSQM